MHIAGRSDQEIRLPIVAKSSNARFEKTAVQLVHQVEGSGNAIGVVVPEMSRSVVNMGTFSHSAGVPLSPFTTTNPDHVFEIHPLTKIQDQALLDSFMPIEGYTTKDATEAFMNYGKQEKPDHVSPSAVRRRSRLAWRDSTMSNLLWKSPVSRRLWRW